MQLVRSDLFSLLVLQIHETQFLIGEDNILTLWGTTRQGANALLNTELGRFRIQRLRKGLNSLGLDEEVCAYTSFTEGEERKPEL